MSDRPIIAALPPVEAMDVVPVEQRPAVLAHLLALQARLVANIATSSTTSQPRVEPPYTLQEAADLLVPKTPTWLQRKARAGRVPGAHKHGKTWVFDREPFDRFRARQQVG